MGTTSLGEDEFIVALTKWHPSLLALQRVGNEEIMCLKHTILICSACFFKEILRFKVLEH